MSHQVGVSFDNVTNHVISKKESNKLKFGLYKNTVLMCRGPMVHKDGGTGEDLLYLFSFRSHKIQHMSVKTFWM